MIEKFLNVKGSLRNLSDDEFESVLPIISSELETVNFYSNYEEIILKKDWMDLKHWNPSVTEIASTQRIGMKLCEQFFPNFYDIENKKGVSFKSLWKSDNLQKVLKWNRKSHITPYLSEIKRGIYFNFNLAKSTMFRPQLAKMIVSGLGAKRVLDPCAGWGGRMLGCVSADCEYIAFEPNIETYTNLINLSQFLGIDDKVKIFNDSALNMNQYDIGVVDLILTSPPYFDLEVYSHENTQSIKGCDSYDIWLDKFLNPLIELSLSHLKENGWSCWNVHNIGKMKMIDDVKNMHSEYKTEKIYTVTSSKRQTNQTETKKKNSDITICYSKKIINNNSLNKFF